MVFKSNFSFSKPQAKSQSSWVIANGPSFKELYQKHKGAMKVDTVFVTNTFALSPFFQEIKPTYYIWLDPFMWTSKSESVVDTYARFSTIDWPLTLFVPFYAMSNVKKLAFSNNKNIKIKGYNYNFFRGFRSVGNYFLRKGWMCPKSSTVTATALYLATLSGSKIIYLVGADQRWHENVELGQDNILMTKVVHFFDNESEVKLQPFYKEGKVENGTNSVTEFFRIQYLTFKSYDDVAQFSKSTDVKIINKTPTSFIDCFEKE